MDINYSYRQVEWKALARVLEEYATALRYQLQQNLLADGSNASGALTNSITYKITYGGSAFDVYISLEDYWKYLNDGTRPHFPPLSAIRKWIEVKHITPQVRNGVLPTVEQLAFLIARKISRVGTQGTSFFDRAANDVYERFIVSIDKAIEEDLGQSVELMLAGI